MGDPLERIEDDILRAVPQDMGTKRSQIFLALDDGQKMIAGQGPHLAGKAASSVGQNDFGFTVPTGVKENIAYRRMAGVILESHAELELSEWDPTPLAAPANMDQPLPKRQQFHECLNGVWCIRMGFSYETIGGGSDL